MDHRTRTYDVFLSYNTRDYAAVERVGRWLQAHGLTCFMDRWYLAPGTPWPAALEAKLKDSRAVAVFLGPGEMGRWQQREQYLALNRQASSGIPIIPVLLPGSDPPLGFLSLNTWVDLRARLDDERQLKTLAAAVRGQAPAEAETEGVAALRSVCPFRGLLPFREEDAPFFFGRQDDTNRLVEAVGHHPFVGVLGASGSGKSSVVLAGLVPRLRSDPTRVWEVVTMVPTARPFNSLVSAFVPLLWPRIEDEVDRREKANEKAGSFEKGTLSLRDLTEIALGEQPGTQRLLLVVDQWEELYTLCRDDKVIRSFTDELLNASRTAQLKVIFTCRADFYGQVLGYRPLVDRIQQKAQVSLGPMDERELREVVQAPAAKVELEFEAGLETRILADVGQEPGRLPLLSFLLEQLWKHRRGTVLTNEAYDEIGGVEGAISTQAEAEFDRLPERDQQILPSIFIQLVSVGEESEDTRRRALLTTLGEEARPLIESLTKARLLVTGSEGGVDTVEVAHEALIRHWDRSKGWVNNARGFLTWRKRLKPFVDEWRNRDRTALLRGGLLAEAQRWLAERGQDLDPPEREFIEAGVQQQEREKQAEAEREQTLVQLSITAKRNEEKAQRNLSASLAAQSAAVRDKLPQRSVLLAVKSVNISMATNLLPVVSAEQSLRDSVQHLGGLGLSGHQGALVALAISHDGRWLVTASDDKTARLWDLTATDPAKTARVLSGHERAVRALAISPDGRWLVTGSDDKTARLWDLKADDPAKTAGVLLGHEGAVNALAISPNGRWLVTGGRDK